MQRLLTFALGQLPTLVQNDQLSEDEKLAIKEKLMLGDSRVMSAFEVLLNKHGGYTPSQHDRGDLAELAESLRCCVKADERNDGTPKDVQHSIMSASLTLVFAAPEMQSVAQEAVNSSNGQFALGRIRWNRFDTANGWPNLYIEDAHHLQFNDVMFLASFHSPDVVFEQLSAIYAIARYACRSLKVIIPFFPTGTMERVEKVGEVATAATLARILSVMPHTASGPTQMVFLDIHALSEQFYFTDDVLVHLKSCIHLLKIRLARLQNTSSCPVVVVFPDDGACKRFGSRFKGFELVVCHKVRDGDKRKVVIRDGLEYVNGAHCVIVDDLVKSGGTLIQCAKALEAGGAKYVSAYVTHACFPEDSWRKFAWEDQSASIDHRAIGAAAAASSGRSIANGISSSSETANRRSRAGSTAELEYWQWLGGRVCDSGALAPIGLRAGGAHTRRSPSPTRRKRAPAASDAKPHFSYFWITNTIPTSAIAVKDVAPFEVLSIAPMLTYMRRSFFASTPHFD